MPCCASEVLSVPEAVTVEREELLKVAAEDCVSLLVPSPPSAAPPNVALAPCVPVPWLPPLSLPLAVAESVACDDHESPDCSL